MSLSITPAPMFEARQGAETVAYDREAPVSARSWRRLIASPTEAEELLLCEARPIRSVSEGGLANRLGALGFAVRLAGLADDVTERLFQRPAKWLVLGVSPSACGALQIIRRVRNNPGHQPRIVVVSTVGDPSVLFRALEAGADAFLGVNDSDEAFRAALLPADKELSLSGGKAREPDWAQVERMHGALFVSESARQLARLALRLHEAPETPVLIHGETGTGKEVMARLVHQGLAVEPGPFVDLNCAAISPQLFESELFGYEGGAFTGAAREGRPGKIEMADGGTLLLDELGEMPLDLQSKLLRVLEERTVRRVGGIRNHPVKIRVIGTTNCDLRKMIKDRRFRRDLYYRLNVGMLEIPPLRERRDAIGPLALQFLRRSAEHHSKIITGISPHALQELLSHPWPGNLRELKNVIDRSVLVEDSHILRELQLDSTVPIAEPDERSAPWPSRQLPWFSGSQRGELTLPDAPFDLWGFEAAVIRSALVKHRHNKSQTAAYLGISRSQLLTRLKQIEV